MNKLADTKEGFHPRNRHRDRYNFTELAQVSPMLENYLLPGHQGELRVDFANPHAVKALNQALLAYFYHVAVWDIPDGYLCPPVPGRADYIHHLADLLSADNQDAILPQAAILDIGVGANCIYPIIGQAEYGWRFTGTDIDREALRNASHIIEANPGLAKMIRLRRQKSPEHILTGIMHKSDRFHATLCNPPFHDSPESARLGNTRKRHNLGKLAEPELNFGGKSHELWCTGGEVGFIGQMIEESRAYAQQVMWFTTLVSKGENLPSIYRAIQQAGAVSVVKKEMAQGHKQSRFIAWSFMDAHQRQRFIRQNQ